MRLGLLASHPIQYQAPWFRQLAKVVDLEVFFAHRQSAAEQGKAGFGVAFEWDVDLLSGYPHTFLKNVARQPDVNQFAGCDTPEIVDIIASGSTVAGLDTKRFDAFFVTGWQLKSYWQAVRACQKHRVPVFVRGDSQLPGPRSFWKRWVKELIYRPLLRQFDGFLVVGERNRQYLKHYGVAEKKIFPVPHFVDNAWFAARARDAAPQRAVLRKSWGADNRTLVALFVGKFISKKRPGDLLKALDRLQSKSIEACGVFVGSGELEAELRAEARRLGVRTEFVGFKNQSELPACYSAADVLVLPSDGGETWGLVVNEAMACGIPAIVSDAVGCGPDLIREGQTGFVFPLGDHVLLAERLTSLAELRKQGHDFTPALAERVNAHSVEAAVHGSLQAIHALAAPR